MRLDVVVDAVNEMSDLRRERVMGDVAVVGLDGRKRPVVQRAWIVFPRIDPIILDGASFAKQAHIEDVRSLAVDERRQLSDLPGFELEWRGDHGGQRS